MRDIMDYVEKYANEPFEADMVEIRRKTVIEQCLRFNHENILEIGCGLNPFFLSFKDYKKMVIVEPGSLFAENAKELARKEALVIEVISGSLEEKIEIITSLGVAFDFVIMSSVLHEIDDPSSMLSAVRSICSKNTVMHINVPNANSLHRLIAIEAGMIDDVHEQSEQMIKMQRRRTYDMELLKEEVNKAGYDILDEGSYFIKPFTHSQMQKCLDEGIIDERVILGLERVIKYMPEYGAGIYVNVRVK